MAKKNQLTDAQCRNASDGEHYDGGGLVLRVGNNGSQKSWALRVMVAGKRHNVGLGSYPAVSLAEARKAAKETRDALKKGKALPAPKSEPDPVIDPDQLAMMQALAQMGAYTSAETIAAIKGPEPPPAPTFREVAEQVIEFRRPTLTSDAYAKKWPESLQRHVYPAIGDKPIDAITGADVLAILRPIWIEFPEASTRVKQRMGTIFDYAIANEYRHDNPATAVNKALPRRPRLKEHLKRLPYQEVPAAVAMIRQSGATQSTRLAFEFDILTVGRQGEVRKMTWAEVAGDVWNVPEENEKMRYARQVNHRVPLSDRAMAILAEARELGDGGPDSLIFPGDKGKPISDATFGKLLRVLEIDCVPHGFRSSFRDWAEEQTAYPHRAIETAMAHSVPGVEGAYLRTDLFEQRQGLMQEWADYVTPD